MSNVRPRKRKPLGDVLTEEQIRLLVEGPNPFSDDYSSPDDIVQRVFGTVTAFRVIYEGYREDIETLAAPERSWAWWALEGPGIEEPPKHLRIVRWHSELKQVPPVMVRQKFLEKVAK